MDKTEIEMHTKWTKKMQRRHSKLTDRVTQGSISRPPVDHRIKNNMFGSSQNIETIATQFRILSTVKATMLSK